jgi:TatA/E family protein of Tat protein translocase
VPFDGAFLPAHWLIIAMVALLVLGPDQLPSLARRAGEAMREVRRVWEHLGSELRELVSDFDLETRSETTPVPVSEAPRGESARELGT